MIEKDSKVITRTHIPVKIFSHLTENPIESFFIFEDPDLEIVKRAIQLIDVGFYFKLTMNRDGTLSYNISDDIDDYVNVMYWPDEQDNLSMAKFEELILQMPVDRVIEIRRDWNERYPSTASID